jgi:mannose-6-phosphate isomerase-like protein (cupin superfamily)
MEGCYAAMTDDRVAVPLAGAALKSAGLVLVEWRDPGGGSDPPRYIAPLHIHHSDDEAWYVLEGTLRFRLDDDEVEAPAGGAVVAPRGTPHTYWNPRPEPARYLLAMTPPIHALIESLHAPGSGDMEAVFRAHDSTLIGWPQP